MDLPPQHVADLAGRGGGGQHRGRIVGTDEPEDRAGGGKSLAQAVARLDSYAPIVSYSVQHLFLPTPQLDSQDFPGEGHGVPPEGPQDGTLGFDFIKGRTCCVIFI